MLGTNMEILPHFWISDNLKNINFVLKKNIKVIIILSRYKKFIKNFNDEQIRIPLEKFDNIKLRNNTIYQHLFDVTSFINQKISENKKILLIGNEFDSNILNIFLMGYLIRYGKIKPNYAYYFLKSKKNNINEPLDSSFYILNKFYIHLNNKF
tara:strand:- start:56 stop:514 length:459 start_codon:yes stop_codon:yes gene_type:complete